MEKNTVMWRRCISAPRISSATIADTGGVKNGERGVKTRHHPNCSSIGSLPHHLMRVYDLMNSIRRR